MQALSATLPGSRVRAGSEPAELAREFEQVLADGATLAFRLAMGVLRNRADAEEVAQEALLRAYRAFPRLRERQAFRSWLCRIAWRLAVDRRRGALRRERREVAAQHKPPGPSAEQLAASNELGTHLGRALDELPAKLRQTLLLAAIEGHSMREVAQLLDLPEGTVKSRLHAGRKILAEKLSYYGPNTTCALNKK
jgi:RNA polymerase sigma-70 factor, ECF subfamily